MILKIEAGERKLTDGAPGLYFNVKVDQYSPCGDSLRRDEEADRKISLG